MNRNTKAQIKLFKEMQKDFKNHYEFFIDQTLPEKALDRAELQLKNKLQEQRRRFFENLRAIDPARLQRGELVRYNGAWWIINKYVRKDVVIMYSNGNKATVHVGNIERME